MFLVVGKGTFLKDNLLMKLKEWGIGDNASSMVREAEVKGRFINSSIRIMLVK